MNPADRAILRALLLIPRRFWYGKPHWFKALFNRWMKHRGDPGDG